MKLSEKEIEQIALGASLLGTGGGGDPHVGKLMALQAVKKHGPVEMIKVEDVPDDALVVPAAMMGAPTVLVEKIPNGNEFIKAFEELGNFLGKKVFATFPIEAGGVNSMIPIAVAANLGIPIIDCDGMGRAFPELQMVTFHLYGQTASPMVLADEKGNSVILNAITNKWAENLARNLVVEMGGEAMISIYSLTGKQLKEAAIRNILTYSAEIGKLLMDTQASKTDTTKQLIEKMNGFKLFKGKITDILRKTTSGFNFGTAKIEGIEENKGEQFSIEFQNENLIAKKGDCVLASVPDLICILDLESATPITTESLKYGRRVTVIGIPCDKKWRTEKGIETVGPRYFGYDIDYTPVEELVLGGASK